jgi:sugar lactone lactonase YvrE
MTRARLFLTLIMVCMVLGPFAAAPSSAHIVGELAAAPEPAPSAAMAPSSAPVITVATFTSPQLPTGLTIDSRGDIYVSMAISGEIRRLARSGGQSVIATFQTGFSPTQFGFLGALVTDYRDDVYAAHLSFNGPGTDTHGIWRVSREGTRQLIAALPSNSFPHAMAFDKRGNLYVSDAFLGLIWKINPAGQLSQWLQHPLFTPDPTVCPPLEAPFAEGLGGLAFSERGDLFVTNLNRATILRVPVSQDGVPGTPTVAFGPDCGNFDGIDGMAIDLQGNIYVANENSHKVLRVSPNGTITPLVTIADNTDSPHAVAFGTAAGERSQLYFLNFAGLTLLAGGTPRPSLMKIDVGVQGRHLP